ncbi:4911_t:CDS:2, partial [Gigaspora margarita]
MVQPIYISKEKWSSWCNMNTAICEYCSENDRIWLEKSDYCKSSMLKLYCYCIMCNKKKLIRKRVKKKKKDYEELKIREEISIFENYKIIAPLYLTIPNDKTSKVYFQLIDDTPIEFYEFYYDSNSYDANFIKAEYAKIISYSKSRFVKFQNVTSFNHYENTIEADKIEYIMYYPDGLFYWDYIEKRFYHESGTYIKYFILTNTYIFVDSK